MISSRFLTVFSSELRFNAIRPLYWIWYLLLVFNAWLLSNGRWIIRSIDTSVGTQKSWVNSEFQIAFAFSLMTVIMMGLFLGIAAGTPIIRDYQRRVNELIGATPLSAREYIWGKFLAHLAAGIGVVLLFVLTLILLNEAFPNPAVADIHGPFRVRNYLGPALAFLIPFLVFTAGTAFALGQITRRSFLVYLFPIALLLFAFNFLFEWFPPNPDRAANYFFQFIDPSGFRWLKQTWLMVDRGVGFYNTNPIDYDLPFLLSRIFWIALGLALIFLSAEHFARRHARVPDMPEKKRVKRRDAAAPRAERITSGSLAGLGMKRRRFGLVRHIRVVTLFELRELFSHPWLYLFIALIAILIVSADQGGTGPLGLQFIYTSGFLALQGMTNLTLLGCFLLLFTNTESLHREVATNLDGLYRATPVPTAAVLLGKALAGFTVVLAALLTSFITILLFVILQGEAKLEFMPFIQVWGGILLPTFIFWTALVTAAYSLTGNRMATYGLGLAFLFLTGWLTFTNDMNWLINWHLAGTVLWSDFGLFELDLEALVLNRLFYLSLAVVLFALSIRYFARRAGDRNRRSPDRSVGMKILAGTAWSVVPLVLGFILWGALQNGFQGARAEKRDEDYWRHNLATWRDAALPHIIFIDMDIRFRPEERGYSLSGSYDCLNLQDEPLYRIPFTGLGYWENLHWTLNGKPYEPENRSGMFVFTPDPPPAPGQKLTVGFDYDGKILPGISKNGGPLILGPPTMGEFILPSGIVLTGRNPYFVPVLGYQDQVGIDDENRYQPREYGPEFHQAVNDSVLDRSLLHTRIRVTLPEDYLVNSVGVASQEKVENGLRTTVWESDHPLRLFNIIAGKWAVRRGNGTAVFYHPDHTYNLDTIVEGLDSARHYFSEWFGPYPWQELRLSEFPGLAFYARGNPTNIFFSETLGFLTLDETQDIGNVFKSNAFYVTAHEAAHQWWGHMLSAADGPGTILLAEGLANYAAFLLVDQVRGEAERMAICRRSERFYGENRFVTSERPLIETDLFRPADVTVIYDKGGWVFFMLHRFLGREQMFAGLTTFIEEWGESRDKPTLQDFLAHMRRFATNPAAYDRFIRQWFFEVGIPEYRFMIAPELQGEDRDWTVRTRVANRGSGTMPVEIAAARGIRFTEGGNYRDTRETLVLGPGEEREVIISCRFRPERLVIDPDVKVLQLQRNAGLIRVQ